MRCGVTRRQEEGEITEAKDIRMEGTKQGFVGMTRIQGGRSNEEKIGGGGEAGREMQRYLITCTCLNNQPWLGTGENVRTD